ncbi:hypothetical protein [Parasphingopyxis lamellibrachiae]|uniref:Uncharacterized protein n=1 Tax=Parasphingopyxis lamellibrachiae TaxID=680125 RepID=A0A3D9FGX6_9SPHN|nr:hypothetical protein [Parasphingopyxis lamellibrachiae]RED16908.1 hypothetical protein DFR46_1942 [Parasphingopyxis lamellibrachiae]
MIWIIFMMGVCNFFLHRSVMEGRGPVFAEVAQALHRFAGGYGGYVVEFLFLVGALWFAKSGQSIILFFYGGYTALNIGTYMMLKHMNRR